MFCYSEKCNGNCIDCRFVRNFKKPYLSFYEFSSENEIVLGRDILCLVSSNNEPPYFIVMTRKLKGMVNALDGMKLKNTKILKYAYLPKYEDG